MSVIARATDAGDRELVAAVRDGDDGAFEELYRRYNRRVAGYVCRMVGDPDRAEDVTQEAFFSALRRLRRTDSEIVFKPWIFEIAKNASIDHFRRTSRAEEVSINPDDGGLRPADHLRLVGGGPAPEVAYEGKERMDHLKGAFDELSDSHSRILVLRELEGLSYREIGERMELTRPAVESTLFRARRRLNEEYAELDTGARCVAVCAAIARLAEGIESARDRRRVGRHAARCSGCRRQARELGVSVETPVRTRVAGLLPIPVLARRRRDAAHDGSAGAAAGGYTSSVHQVAGTWAPAIVTTGAAEGTAHAWGKAAAIVATLALAGGGAAIQERVVNAERGTETEEVAPAGDGGARDGGDPARGGPGAPAGPRGQRDGSGGTGGGGTRAGNLLPDVPRVSPSPGSAPAVTPPAFGPPAVAPPGAGPFPAPPARRDVTGITEEITGPSPARPDQALGDLGSTTLEGATGVVPLLPPVTPPEQIDVPPPPQGSVNPPAPPGSPEITLPGG
ncbi:MAG: sigma-70 family RNA polymerase sigma factor [Thermoleophilaceae bacterium]